MRFAEVEAVVVVAAVPVDWILMMNPAELVVGWTEHSWTRGLLG